MKKELDELLCNTYPAIFVDRRGDMTKTAMCWGFECSDGWYNILNCLCHAITEHIDNSIRSRDWTIQWNKNVNDPEYEWTAFVPREERPIPDIVEQVVATQVKEKFGSLRFYYNGGDDYIDGLVRMAELISEHTCEVCGDKGELSSSGWYKTLCDRHKKEYFK